MWIDRCVDTECRPRGALNRFRAALLGFLCPVILLSLVLSLNLGLPGSSMAKNLPANTRDAGDVDLIPGSGRPREENSNPLQYSIAWRIPRTEERGGLQSQSHKETRLSDGARTRASVFGLSHGCRCTS